MYLYIICENVNGQFKELEVYFDEESAEEVLTDYKSRADGRIYFINTVNALSDHFIIRHKLELKGYRTLKGQYESFKECIKKEYREYSWVLFCLRKGQLISNKQLKKLK